jgi:protein-L-isoaspartate(D-aspartate) O-methyltransferase
MPKSKQPSVEAFARGVKPETTASVRSASKSKTESRLPSLRYAFDDVEFARTQAAQIKPSDRVLEIGAGSGYGAAVLSHLAQRVWSIERHPRLARMAGSRIAELGRANVTVLRADGTNGWPPAAPFDAIIVTAGGPAVPEPLKEQLNVGGRLIIPVGAHEGLQNLMKVTRISAAEWIEEDLGPVQFVPLVGEHGWNG